MTQPTPTRINAYRSAVVATFAAAFGKKLRSVEEQFGRFNLEELERTSIAAPSLRFAVLETPMEQQADASLEAHLRVAAFLIAEGKTADADAWALAEVAACMLPNQRWGLQKILVPEKVSVQPVIAGGFKSKNVAIVAVEWRQKLVQLGTAIFDAQGVVLESVLLNGAELEPADAQ